MAEALVETIVDEAPPIIGEGARTHDTTLIEGSPEKTEDNNPDEKADESPVDPVDEKAPPEKEESKKSLTGLDEDAPKDAKKDDPPKFDQRILNEKGEFDPKLAQEVAKEWEDKEEKYNKRINDMRRMVSGKVDNVEDKVEFFQDYVAPEEFLPVFADDAPESTKKTLTKFQDKLSEKYLEAGLNKKQGYEISNTVLEILKDTKVIDTRTKEDFEKDTEVWVKEQSTILGDNAQGIIRESANWVLNDPRFTEATKSKIIKNMDDLGADFISVIYSLKEAHSGNNIPTNVSDLGGLPNDVELANEYLKAGTSNARKEQITQQRAVAGRKSRLMDAVRNQ